MRNKQITAIARVGDGARARRRRPAPIILDSYRGIVFPNAMRSLRKRGGFPKLLELTISIPDIPYIRLSKIERGEVVAKAGEIIRIAEALSVKPDDLIIDIDNPDFKIADWASEIHEIDRTDREAEELAVMLAAAMRLRRTSDKGLSIAVIENQYGIPPVILSRIENAHKTLDRWNEATLRSLCRVFGVADVEALKAAVHALYRDGQLDELVGEISNPQARIAKTREKVAELRAQLSGRSAIGKVRSSENAMPAADMDTAAGEQPFLTTGISPATAYVRLLPVFGAPLPDGLIALAPTSATIEAPRGAGDRAYGLRVLRPTLGGGLPARATVVVDPDRFPSSGLAVVREGQGYRILAVAVDRNGTMTGYSESPDREVAIDEFHPSDVAAVLSAVFE